MHILHIGTSATKGGASIAMYRLHKALLEVSIHSSVLVQHKSTSDPNVIVASQLTNRAAALSLRWSEWREKQQVTGIRKDTKKAWSNNSTDNALAYAINRHPADIVNLHWVGAGFLPIQALQRIQKPIVWTMHDMWTITGGCHYAGDCQQFRAGCAQCPQLMHPHQHDTSYHVFKKKREHWSTLQFRTVAPSHWLATIAQNSPLLAHQQPALTIPNPIDTQQFKPLDKTHSRKALSLPEAQKIILFGAVTRDNPFKGYGYLCESLQKIASTQPDCVFVSFGGGQAQMLSAELGVPVYPLGSLHDEVSLALAYSAADVMVAPSLQDNLPNTVMESLACGTPVVAFNIGGMPDLIQHQKTGYLAAPYDTTELAHGIQWVLAHETSAQLSEQARAHVLANYTNERVARRYIALYESLMNERH